VTSRLEASALDGDAALHGVLDWLLPFLYAGERCSAERHWRCAVMGDLCCTPCRDEQRWLRLTTVLKGAACARYAARCVIGWRAALRERVWGTNRWGGTSGSLK
jgi:hypothetical protein